MLIDSGLEKFGFLLVLAMNTSKKYGQKFKSSEFQIVCIARVPGDSK
jgi:hypothetical protein